MINDVIKLIKMYNFDELLNLEIEIITGTVRILPTCAQIMKTQMFKKYWFN